MKEESILEYQITKEGLDLLNKTYKQEKDKFFNLLKKQTDRYNYMDIDKIDILDLFNTIAPNEDLDAVNDLYKREFKYKLEDIGMKDKETFDIDDMEALYIRTALERDLDTELVKYGYGIDSDIYTKIKTIGLYIDDVKTVLETYKKK